MNNIDIAWKEFINSGKLSIISKEIEKKKLSLNVVKYIYQPKQKLPI